MGAAAYRWGPVPGRSTRSRRLLGEMVVQRPQLDLSDDRRPVTLVLQVDPLPGQPDLDIGPQRQHVPDGPTVGTEDAVTAMQARLVGW